MKGRPTKYKEEYCDALYDHYNIPAYKQQTVLEKNDDGEWEEVLTANYVANRIPSVVSFCRELKINRDTFYEWVGKHKDFSDTYKNCLVIAEDIWAENSMFSRYDKAYTIFYGKNIFGWKDKQEIQVEKRDTSQIKSILAQYETNE